MNLSRAISGVTVNTSSYYFIWNRQPRGYGRWAFFWGHNGEGEAHWYNGTFAEARSQAVRDAKAAGVTLISVGS